MRIARPQFGLRDLLWLTLAVAAVTGWILEHRGLSSHIEDSSRSFFFLREQRERSPSDASITRKALLKNLSRWTDRQLAESFSQRSTTETFASEPDYEPYLCEMARRGLVSELAAQHDKLLAAGSGIDRDLFSRTDNFALLIAMRRAQGERDPLRIHVQQAKHDQLRMGDSHSWIATTVENVDVHKEAIYFLDGCDDRGGRRERWRVVLTDSAGRKVPESNFEPLMGGGLGTSGPLKYGDTTSKHFLPLCRYVAPPRSGSYQLEVYYHNAEDIARESDLTGLIVLKSEPIPVLVANPAEEWSKQSVGRFVPWFTAVIAVGSLLMMDAYRFITKRRRVPPKLRNRAWCAVIISISLGWWLDQLRLHEQIARLTPDAESKWMAKLVSDN